MARELLGGVGAMLRQGLAEDDMHVRFQRTDVVTGGGSEVLSSDAHQNSGAPLTVLLTHPVSSLRKEQAAC